MSDGHIPVNAEDLPIDAVMLDDSLVYRMSLQKAMFPVKKSKKDVLFIGMSFQVVEGDYEGQTVNLNYMPLPVPVFEDMKKSDRIQAQNNSAAFGRFCRAFGIRGSLDELYKVTLEDQDSQRAASEWFDKHIGKVGSVTIANQEFPEGSGRQRSSVKDFVA